MATIVDNFSGTPLEGKGLRIEIDYATRTDGQPVYVGFAQPSENSTTDQPVWKIMFCEYNGTLAAGNLIRRRFALDDAGRANYTNVYDDRATLTYG